MLRTTLSVLCLAFAMCAGLAVKAAPISSVASVAELQAQVPSGAMLVLSYYSSLNRGGGLFIWDANSNAPANSCTVFFGKGISTGRWLRQLSGPLDVTMCGAWWDNIHDDAAALNQAFQVAAAQRLTLSLPGGVGKVCSSVAAARAVIVRGQGMGTAGAVAESPTLVDGSCMKSGWVFELASPNGTNQFEAPKYYDMSIKTTGTSAPGGCIRWNKANGGFTDDATSQYYMVHPHAERIYCEMQGSSQIGFECSKCFDGDFSQNNIVFGKTSIALEGSDVMCIGCAGPNRVSYSNDALIRLTAHNTFGNMDRVVGNEILYPYDLHQRYDAYIFDSSRSSTIEANHIEGIIPGAQSGIHVVGGFSHAILNNDIDVLVSGGRAAPHWLVADGPFVNFQASNNGCGGCVLGSALFKNSIGNFNDGGARQVITHGGNAANGDSGFP